MDVSSYSQGLAPSLSLSLPPSFFLSLAHSFARSLTKSVGEAPHNAGNIAQLVVPAKAAAVGSRIAARRALAMRVLDVLPDALLAETVLARRTARVGEEIETDRAFGLEDELLHRRLHVRARTAFHPRHRYCYARRQLGGRARRHALPIDVSWSGVHQTARLHLQHSRDCARAICGGSQVHT